MVEDLHGGVPESEPPDAHVELRLGQSGLGQSGLGQGVQREARDRDLGDREEAGHQEVVVELDLVDVLTRTGVAAPPEADRSHRRLLPVELLESSAHGLVRSTAASSSIWA